MRKLEIRPGRYKLVPDDPPPPCRHRGEPLTGRAREAAGLDHARAWRHCLHADPQPLGPFVCACKGCGPGCAGYDPGAAQIVVTAEGIGDHLLGLTVAAAWKRDHPGTELHYVAKGHAVPWLRLFGGYDRLVTAEDPALPHAWVAGNSGSHHFVDACRSVPGRVRPEARPLPADALTWAEACRGCVALAPWACAAHRDWPLDRWLALERLLALRGFRCVVLGAAGAPDARAAPFPCVRILGESPARVAAVLKACRCLVGNESGLAHLAGALGVPAVVLSWDRDGPAVHSVWGSTVLQAPPYAIEPRAVCAAVRRLCPGDRPAVPAPAPPPTALGGLTAPGFTARYYEEHKAAGLDYLGHGDWQERYGRWLVGSLGWEARQVLDVGCACGSVLRGLCRAGCAGRGVDLCEHMIQLGRAEWPDLADLLAVCDAVNLHPYEAGAFDGLHSAQAAEHWQPELVPFILRELARVVRPGGLFFCCLDTEELFARQGRRMETEDPTHVCIRPLAWWHEQLRAAGWQVCTGDYAPALHAHPDTFLARYDWDWFVARRAA